LSLLDRYKKDSADWKGTSVIKEEPADGYGSSAGDYRSGDDELDDRQRQRRVALTTTVKPSDEDGDCRGEDDIDADFESPMKNEPDDMFDDDNHDMAWDKVSTSSGGH